MLFVLCEIESRRYAIPAARIAEVLPLVHITPVADAPRGVAGVFNYRGTPVPVVDLTSLVLGRPAVPRYSTRLLLMHWTDDRGGSRRLGLIAEHATATLQRNAADFVPSGVTGESAWSNGPVATDPGGVVQWIDPTRILPRAVHDALFQQPAER
jgi:chemotaxis-related protein WspB